MKAKLFLLLFVLMPLTSKAIYLFECPKIIVERYNNVSRKDTFIVYLRMCGACHDGVEYTAYFMYRDKKKTKLEVYKWRKGESFGYEFHKLLNDSLNDEIFHFIKSNFHQLQIESTNQTPWYIANYVKNSKGDSATIYIGNEGTHGPYIDFHVKLGAKYMESSIFGASNIKQYKEKLPAIAKMMLLFHQSFSVFSVNDIVDEPH